MEYLDCKSSQAHNDLAKLYSWMIDPETNQHTYQDYRKNCKDNTFTLLYEMFKFMRHEISLLMENKVQQGAVVTKNGDTVNKASSPRAKIPPKNGPLEDDYDKGRARARKRRFRRGSDAPGNEYWGLLAAFNFVRVCIEGRWVVATVSRIPSCDCFEI